MNPGHDDAAEILDAFRSASIVFQPIVELQGWRVTGFEALARMTDGTPPPPWLDRAEAAGIREQAEIVLIDAALRAAAALPAGLSVTYNASGATILLPALHDLFASTDRPWGLELYEGSTAADLGEVRAAVTRLGGQLLVDDAGAASADETRITTLRPDVVKIDRALFWQISEDADALRHLERLLVAARATGAKVLVEGVSDPEQVERARELGADYLQGFHLGMPTPAAGMPALLADLQRRVGVDAPGL
ncbi:EAL domain-containing protein [Microbacterium sp. NPDC089698]|uniref:EAL domain-containing protein n=1 Tax=Microbacterium sp. NPDC089698 TaxID=3364200 RepID=UPI0037F14934